MATSLACRYGGFNSHMLLLRPSLDLYAILSANAAHGHFIPYTRGEQERTAALCGTDVLRYSSDYFMFPHPFKGDCWLATAVR